MRLMHDDTELRVAPELLARWALETPQPAREATYQALAFLACVEHAAVTLLPVPALLLSEQAVLDPDGFLRQPRGALEHFRARGKRALAWMEQLVFFRERFPGAAQRAPADNLFALARSFTRHDDALESAVDVLIRECVMPEIEELLLRSLTYPPLRAMLGRLREADPQRSADARRLASAVLGELSGKNVWLVRKRLVAGTTRAILGARPLLDALVQGGLAVDRARAARGFARRLEEAVSELSGVRVLPVSLVARLAGTADGEWSAEAKGANDDTSAEKKRRRP